MSYLSASAYKQIDGIVMAAKQVQVSNGQKKSRIATEVFVQFYSKLRENVDPDDISAELFAKGIISRNEKADVDIRMFTPQVRMDKLLAAVQRSIHISPQRFDTFVDILEQKKYKDLAAEMRENPYNGETT